MKAYAKNLKSAIHNVLSKIKEQGIKMYIPVAADVLFLFIYAALTAGIFRKIREHAYAIQAVIAQNSGSLSEIFIESGLSGALAQSDVLRQLLWRTIGLVAILAITAYIIYCVLQAIAWRLALNIQKKKLMNEYVKKFFIVNAVWFPLFLVYYTASTGFYFSDLIQNLTRAGVGSIVTYIGFLILLYLATISYALLDTRTPWTSIKHSFLLGFGHAHYLVLPGAALIVALLILTQAFEFIVQFNLFLGLAFGILTILPCLTIARLFLSELLKKQ